MEMSVKEHSISVVEDSATSSSTDTITSYQSKAWNRLTIQNETQLSVLHAKSRDKLDALEWAFPFWTSVTEHYQEEIWKTSVG